MTEGGGGDDDVQGLMTRLADGDRRAFSPLYEALWPLCRARARRCTDDEAEAEDAAQRALWKLFGQAASFDGARSATGWALTLTDWECRTSAKKRQRRREAALVDVHESEEVPAEKRLFAAHLWQRLSAAVAALSGSERATLQTFLDDEGGPKDAAFRKRKQRVLARLKHLARSPHDDG